MGNVIIFYFFYGLRISESAVSAIAIAIAAMGVAAYFAIFGAQTLFGVCLGHDDLSFVLYSAGSCVDSEASLLR